MEGPEQQVTSGGTTDSVVPLFVAAAHELKSPLALIRQLSLSLESGEYTAKDIETLARRITLTSERALRLTTNLTRSSRLEDSLFELEPLNPVALCEEVVHELEPLYAAKGRTLRLAKRSRPLLALANRDLLRRILLNFADNALHYSESNSPVVISAQTVGGAVRLGVRDYGPALPANLWKSLGSSLGAHARPLHSRPESSGLGIYIAHQFAEAMNGSVGAKRHRDGATFYVDVSSSAQLRLL
jgi:signal transduction histidine kinase